MMLRCCPCQFLRITLSSSLISLKWTRWSYISLHTTPSQPLWACVYACASVCSFSCKFYSRTKCQVVWAIVIENVQKKRNDSNFGAGRMRVVNFYCYRYIYVFKKYRCWIDNTYRCCFMSKIFHLSKRRKKSELKFFFAWNIFRLLFFFLFLPFRSLYFRCCCCKMLSVLQRRKKKAVEI